MANNISGNKLLFHCASIAARTPITADVFLNDYCNNRCPYCTYARYGDRNGEYMKFEDFKRYAHILLTAGVKGIILTGGGEPTISKDFDQITEWLEEMGIEYGINTNFNVLKYIRPRYLKVSLDAYDRESYIARRGVDKYEQTVDNVRKYLAWKKENGVKTSVGIQIVVESLDDAKKFYEAHKDLDVDYMNFRPMESTLHSYYDTHDETEILRGLEEMREHDSRVGINYKWYSLRDRFDKCYAQFAQIAINQRGEVMYCCHKPYEIIGRLDDVEIWDKIKNAKTNLNMCDVPCRLTAPNQIVRAIEAGGTDTAFI